MFDKLKFWKKSPQPIPEEVAVKIPNINLAEFLVTMMQEGLRWVEKERKLNLPDVTDIEKEYLRLKKLGLENSKNATELKMDIDQADSIKARIRKAEDMVTFVKEALRVFGEKTILISREAFLKVLDDYSLEVGLLQNYKGVIPPENIKDLEKVRERLGKFIFKDYLGTDDNYHGLLKVNYVSYYYGEEKTFFRPLIRKYYGCCVPIKRKLQSGEYWRGYIDSVVGAREVLEKSLGKLEGTFIGTGTFMIACPGKYLKDNDIKVSSFVIDPIIFQPCPFGVLIHTMWGEEAESDVLKRYLEITKKINEM